MDDHDAPRPWWTSLPLAFAATLATLLLGLFVSSYFFGVTFFVVPFLWMPRRRRR